MIPLSCRESVEHTDEDGIVWKFRPVTGETENEFFDISKMEQVEQMKRGAELLDRVFIGMNDPKGRAVFPKDKKASQVFCYSDTVSVLTLWIKSGRLGDEEKKS